MYSHIVLFELRHWKPITIINDKLNLIQIDLGVSELLVQCAEESETFSFVVLVVSSVGNDIIIIYRLSYKPIQLCRWRSLNA